MGITALNPPCFLELLSRMHQRIAELLAQVEADDTYDTRSLVAVLTRTDSGDAAYLVGSADNSAHSSRAGAGSSATILPHIPNRARTPAPPSMGPRDSRE